MSLNIQEFYDSWSLDHTGLDDSSLERTSPSVLGILFMGSKWECCTIFLSDVPGKVLGLGFSNWFSICPCTHVFLIYFDKFIGRYVSIFSHKVFWVCVSGVVLSSWVYMHNKAQSNPALTFPLKLEPNAPYKIVMQSKAQLESYCSSHMGQLRTE